MWPGVDPITGLENRTTKFHFSLYGAWPSLCLYHPSELLPWWVCEEGTTALPIPSKLHTQWVYLQVQLGYSNKLQRSSYQNLLLLGTMFMCVPRTTAQLAWAEQPWPAGVQEASLSAWGCSVLAQRAVEKLTGAQAYYHAGLASRQTPNYNTLVPQSPSPWGFWHT